jgi:HNH endonuclease
MKREIAEQVINRAQGYCEFCGRVATESMALHHRKLKSRGGKDSVSNLVWIHHECHNLGTHSVHLNPQMAEERGFMVGSWQDPHEVPIKSPDGNFYLLSDDGTMKKLGVANELDYR